MPALHPALAASGHLGSISKFEGCPTYGSHCLTDAVGREQLTTCECQRGAAVSLQSRLGCPVLKQPDVLYASTISLQTDQLRQPLMAQQIQPVGLFSPRP